MITMAIQIGMILLSWVSLTWAVREWQRLGQTSFLEQSYRVLIPFVIGGITWGSWLNNQTFEVGGRVGATVLLMVAGWGLMPWISPKERTSCFKYFQSIISLVLVGIGLSFYFI